MVGLTFGEQVKIVLSRKGMTIKELAEQIEERTGKKMSRQNLTQRLGRDNFQEQDMRMIAEILGCSFQLSILASLEAEKASYIEEELPTDKELLKLSAKKEKKAERQAEKEKQKEAEAKELTIGEFVEATVEPAPEETKVEMAIEVEEKKAPAIEVTEKKTSHYPTHVNKYSDFRPIKSHVDDDEDTTIGDVNPYTGHEYKTNSVRTHPKRLGYVQVYDRKDHKWTDMTEWAFLGMEERKKATQGKDYQKPIYLD